MKRLCILLAAGALILFPGAVYAGTTCNIFNGCTGTSTAPGYGQMLIGGANGEYELVASSSLGGGGGGGGSGTVTSVALSLPSGFTVSGSPVTVSGTLTGAWASGYGPVLTASSTNWNSAYNGWNANNANWTTAYNDRITSATYPLSISSNVISTVATSSLNLTTSSFASQNISQWTNDSGYLTPTTFATDFDQRLSATTSLPNLTTLAGLSLPYTQLTGTPNLAQYLTLANWFATTSAPQITTESNLATVGTITTGTWHATAISDSYISSAANWNTAYADRITSAAYPLSISSNALSIVATSSENCTVSCFASHNVSQWTNDAGYLTSAVTSVTGTANQITSSGGSTPVLSLPSLVVFPLDASTTQLSVTQQAYFGGSATSTFDSQGRFTFGGNGNLGANILYGSSFGSGEYLSMNGAGGYQLENGNNGYGIKIGGDNNELTPGGEGHVFLGWNSNAGFSYLSGAVLQLGNGTYGDESGGLIAASSTWQNITTTQASTTQFTASSNVWFPGLTAGAGNGSLCLTSSGQVQYESGANCVTGSSASSTLLSDNNTFSGNDAFTKPLSLTYASSTAITVNGTTYTNALVLNGTSFTLPVSIANGGTGLSTIGASSTVLTTNGTAAAWQQLNLSSITGSISLSSQVSGTLPVGNGGTGASSFGQGWIYSSGGTGAFAASTSPTVNYITSTSTTATSTFAYGINLTGGCFSVSSTCVTTTAPGGSTSQVQYDNGGVFGGASNLTYSSTGATAIATSSATPGIGLLSGTSSESSAFSGFYVASSTCTGTCTAHWQTEGANGTGGNIIRYLLNQNLTLTLNTTTSQPLPGAFDLRFCENGVGGYTVTISGGLTNYSGLVSQTSGTLNMAATANTCEDFGGIYDPGTDSVHPYTIEASSTPYSNQ